MQTSPYAYIKGWCKCEIRILYVYTVLDNLFFSGHIELDHLFNLWDYDTLYSELMQFLCGSGAKWSRRIVGYCAASFVCHVQKRNTSQVGGETKQVTHLKDCIHNSSPFVVDIHDTDLNHEDLHGKWSKGTKNYSPGAGTPTWGYKFADLFRTHNSL
jgi:hypothetical protein